VKLSAWNASKLLLVPGNTMTDGPVGTVTQAVSNNAGASANNRIDISIAPP
jgi:hypothetical protein